jgi:hypothetical protein
MKDLMETCADLGFQVFGFDEEGVFEMRPVEMMFGPTGAVRVDLDANGGDAVVVCRNSLKGRDNYFFTTLELGTRVESWLKAGKPGNVQDVFPEFNIEQREMMISGMSNEEFEEACR